MALDAQKLAKEIEAAMSKHGFHPLADKGAGHHWWLALAEGIVKHIQQDAETICPKGQGKVR